MPENFNKVIIAGDACVDVHIALKDLLSNDENKVTPYNTSPGGTSAGCAVVLSCLGVDTAYLGTLGSDFGGKYLIKELKRNNIDISLTSINDKTNTMNVFAFIDDEGERHLWGFPRNDVSYGVLNLDESIISKVASARWLHASGMCLLADGNIKQTLPLLFKAAYEAGVDTSFDLNTRVKDISLLDEKAVEAIREIIPYVKYLTGSALDEFVSFYPCDDYLDSLRHFANDATVIARLGEKGVYVIDKGKEELVSAYNVEVLDTTGAGDTFDAGFICAMLSGKDVFEAARFANASAAYKISHSLDSKISVDKVNDIINNVSTR